MGLYDDYRNRLNVQGASMADTYSSDTEAYINATFADSPFFYQLPLNNVDTDCRVESDDKTSNIKYLTFRPNTVVNLGSIIQFQSFNWLLTDFYNNPIHPKATIEKCNDTIKWYDDKGTLHSVPAVVSNKNRKTIWQEDKVQMLGDYQIYIDAPINSETKLCVVSQRFLLGTPPQPYRVLGMDTSSFSYGGYGYIDFSCNIDRMLSTDDTVNAIADNSHLWKRNDANPNGDDTKLW